jgi:hypothetical protein
MPFENSFSCIRSAASEHQVAADHSDLCADEQSQAKHMLCADFIYAHHCVLEHLFGLT